MGYSEMARDALTNGKGTTAASKTRPELASSDTTSIIANNDALRMPTIFLVTVVSLLAFFLIVATIYLHLLCQSATNISHEILALRVLSQQILLQLKNE